MATYLNIQHAATAVAKTMLRSRSNLAFGAALSKFNKNKRELLESFNNHEVTKEIEEAENSGDPITVGNSSGLLDGKGNLFTFLGFSIGRKPIAELRAFLEGSLPKLENRPKVRVNNNIITFSFDVKLPKQSEIEAATLLEWENGNSWVRGIERGVSGFSNYIYWKRILNNPEVSRSTGGTQAANNLRATNMSTTPYLLKMLGRFKAEIEE